MARVQSSSPVPHSARFVNVKIRSESALRRGRQAKELVATALFACLRLQWVVAACRPRCRGSNLQHSLCTRDSF